MYTLEELKKQNQEISQLCDVLSPLMEKESLHNNPFVCELMTRFKEKVWVHLVFEENTIYAAFLNHNDEEISQMAKNFHQSAKKIKHRFAAFVRNWCSLPGSESEHKLLSNESKEIFALIRERITYETSHIFPLIEKTNVT